ncbi:hypothetical protein RZS08_24805, partial [Arthrospira platensis SPKY1]|nr:hypothetical protein [Arthrospira platensis SPKY1]
MIIHHIKELAGIAPEELRLRKGAEMSQLPSISNAFLLIEGEKIADYGPMDSEKYRHLIASNN